MEMPGYCSTGSGRGSTMSGEVEIKGAEVYGSEILGEKGARAANQMVDEMRRIRSGL